MKTLCISLALTVAVLSIAVVSYAGSPIVGVIQPASSERITVSVGDNATVNLGTKHGLIVGDIGVIVLDASIKSKDNAIGRCAITKTGFDTSVCEVVTAKREIEKGNRVVFSSVQFNDGNYYSAAMNTIAAIVEPYEPHVHLNVCVYGLYDANNAVTELSEDMEREFKGIFAQKNRLRLVSKDVLRDLVMYPNLSDELLSFARNEMKRNSLDAILLGTYTLVDGQLALTVRKIDKNGADRDLSFSFPARSKYTELDSKTILTAREMTKSRAIPCNVVLRAIPKLLPREEKSRLTRTEAAGNPVILQNLRALDFNVVGPVDVKAVIDEEALSPSKQGSVLMLSTGVHTMTVSFRRGYYFNETLLYPSEEETMKHVALDLSKEKGLVIEIGIDASLTDDPVSLTMYHPTQRQRQILNRYAPSNQKGRSRHSKTNNLRAA
jgi:hypothetical protein